MKQNVCYLLLFGYNAPDERLLLVRGLVVPFDLLQLCGSHEELVLLLGVRGVEEVPGCVLGEHGHRVVHLDVEALQDVGQLRLLVRHHSFYNISNLGRAKEIGREYR